LKFQYSYNCELSKFSPLYPKRGLEFEAGIGALITAARPYEVTVVISLSFNIMSAYGVPRTRVSKPLHICAHDEPMTMTDCESILVEILTSDAVKAYRAVQDAFAEKRRRLEVHRSHRVCFVRLSLKVGLERLEMAEKEIHEVLENLPGFPKPS